MSCRQPQEIVGRRVGVAALIVEADHVAQGVIAEDDAQLGVALAHLVGPIQLLRVAHVALAVAADEALRRVR